MPLFPLNPPFFHLPHARTITHTITHNITRSFCAFDVSRSFVERCSPLPLFSARPLSSLLSLLLSIFFVFSVFTSLSSITSLHLLCLIPRHSQTKPSTFLCITNGSHSLIFTIPLSTIRFLPSPLYTNVHIHYQGIIVVQNNKMNLIFRDSCCLLATAVSKQLINCPTMHLKLAIEFRHRHFKGRLVTNTDIFLSDLLG